MLALPSLSGREVEAGVMCRGASSLAVRSAASKHPALQKQVVSVLGSPKAKASPKSPHFRRHGALMTCR